MIAGPSPFIVYAELEFYQLGEFLARNENIVDMIWAIFSPMHVECRVWLVAEVAMVYQMVRAAKPLNRQQSDGGGKIAVEMKITSRWFEAKSISNKNAESLVRVFPYPRVIRKVVPVSMVSGILTFLDYGNVWIVFEDEMALPAKCHVAVPRYYPHLTPASKTRTSLVQSVPYCPSLSDPTGLSEPCGQG